MRVIFRLRMVGRAPRKMLVGVWRVRFAPMQSYEDAKRAAEAIREAQLDQLATAAKRLLTHSSPPPTTIVISGQGEFLARQLVERIDYQGPVFSLAQHLGPKVSRCACAHALATLVRERAGE